MKNSKFKNFIFCFIVAVSAVTFFFTYSPNTRESFRNLAYSFTTNVITSSNRDGASTLTCTEEGSIPFSLYTTKANGPNDYEIIEYFGEYTASTSNDSGSSSKVIYHYTINEDSIPYIMLSSKSGDEYYDRTLVFKFNDLDFITSSTTTYIPNQAGYMTIDGSINGTQIYADKTPSPSTDNTSVIFKVNLQSLMVNSGSEYVANANCECPKLSDGINYLGGNNIHNDVSFRTGLYRFKINYNFKDQTTNETSNECIFETAFYLLDYNTYVEDASPLTFTNTNTYNDSDYEVFNYNYKNAPVVEVDATKFAPNFLYTTGYLNYNFTYSNFNAIYSRTNVANVSYGTQTGWLTLKLDDSDLTYSIPAYKALPKEENRRLTITYTNDSATTPFSPTASLEYFKSPNASDGDNEIVFHFCSALSEATFRYLVWADNNNNGIFDGVDTFYLETSTYPDGYTKGTDYLWKDDNNNHILDKSDFFFIDSNNNGVFDSTETVRTNIDSDPNKARYGISKIELNSLAYFARFDLQDFETNFLIPNKINSTFLGTYSFNLDFLIQNSVGNYSIFSNKLVPKASSDVNNKKLVAFGYNLKYYDQNSSSSTYHNNVELKNNYTWTNFISYNGATVDNDLVDVTTSDEETGYMKNVPTALAITNQAPLRFDYFGNLKGPGDDYNALATSLDYKTTSEESILADFNSYIKTETEHAVDTRLTSNNYYQGSAISSDGIKILKLVYVVTVFIDDNPEQISGCQYFAFEINNTIQSLYIQAIDYDQYGNVTTSYDFNRYTNKDVRVNIEYKKNTFFSPVIVTYYHYRNYSTSGSYNMGRLNLKTEGTTAVKYTIDSKEYNYFVLNNNNKYSFTTSGLYKIVIKDAVANVPTTYFFTIDKDSFEEVQVRKATLSGAYNYVLDDPISSTLLTNPTSLNRYNLMISNEAFTLGWNEKPSGARSYSSVYYMEMQNLANLESTLYKNNNQYWLTNGYALSAPSGGIDTYVNYKTKPNYESSYLDAKSYFNKDGLYIFYVYDEAGNFFTRSVLIDRTLGKILQGYWDENTSLWVDNFDPTGNPENYVNTDTTLYFGTHKAISLPNMSVTNNVSIEDISFTRAYDLTDAAGVLIEEKAPITFDLYADILNRYTSLIQSTTTAPMIQSAGFVAPSTYYLTLENTAVSYTRVYENGEDVSGSPIVARAQGNINEIYFSKIYKNETRASLDTPAMYSIAQYYRFYGESQYKYLVTNINGLQYSKNIEMNFDIVKGSFYAYNKTNNSTPIDRFIRKNSGTNLDVLKFIYNKIDGETAPYYALSELSYSFYEFVLDESSADFSNATYPFSNTVTKFDNTLLNSKIYDSSTNKYTIDAINLNATGLTQPGKYIITRTYVGGDYEYIGTDGDFNNPDNFQYVGTGGSYYKDSNDNFIDLFEDDVLVRKYTVYVDHYDIVSTSYMVRNDEQQNIREVGNFISLTLNFSYNDEWNFKEFFLTSSSLNLNTNKVPVKINIPLSKFFVNYYSSTNNIYAKQSFAELDVIVYYQDSPTTAWKKYVIDGYNANGLCTFAQFNNGELIFTAAGTYRITIEDHTGYLDNTSNAANADNLDPTKFFGDEGFTFTINHIAPSASAKQQTFNYSENKFNNEETLINVYNNLVFATNIKEKNYAQLLNVSEDDFNSSCGDDDTSSIYFVYNNDTYTPARKPYSSTTKYYVDKGNNQMLLTWSDPITPYEAKIKQISVTVSGGNLSNSSRSYVIDLLSKNNLGALKYNLQALAEITEGDKVLTYTFDDFSYIEYFKITYYNNISSASIYDFTEYYRYTYTLSLNISSEYSYSIDLSYISNSVANQSYKDENGNSYADSIYTMYIDRTKPNTNINSLLNAETYLISSNYYSSSTLSDFKEENFDVSLQKLQQTPSAFTYAFAVTNNYQLNYNSSETMPYFFVRSYSKYRNNSSSLASTYSSITPDMVDTVYSNEKAYYDKNLDTKFPAYYPRFSEIEGDIISIGNNTWYKINYQRNINLRNLIATATHVSNPVGFYEIIERDLAGNYRCYTVYFNEYTYIYQNISIDGYTQKNNTTYLISTGDYANKDNISASVEIELTDLSSHLGWGTLTIKNETSSIEFGSVILTPYNNILELRPEINPFLNPELNSKFSFKLESYNTNFRSTQLARYINFDIDGEGELDRPTIEEYVYSGTGATLYNIILPIYDSTKVLYLEEFTLNLITISPSNNTSETTLYSYSTKEEIPNKITGLAKGVYKAIYKDNFNSYRYYYLLHLGEFYINNFDNEYSFEYSNYLQTNNIGDVEVYYSGGKVYVTYESNIYNAYVNNIVYSGTANERTSTTFAQCKTFTLYPSDNGYIEYLIEYKDKIDGSKGKTSVLIKIYSSLPDVVLISTSNNKPISERDAQEISSIVELNWGYLTFDYNNFRTYLIADYESSALSTEDRNLIKSQDIVSATLYRRNDAMKYTSGVNLPSRLQEVKEEGYYKLVITNSLLGNIKELYFALNFQDIPFYTVYANDVKLNASSFEQLNIAEELISDELIISKLYNAMYGISDDILSPSTKATLSKQFGFVDNAFNLSNIGIVNLTSIPHFYTINTPQITYNTNISYSVIEFTFKNNQLQNTTELVLEFDEDTNLSVNNPLLRLSSVGSDYWTTIFLVYSLDAPIKIEFFAITKVPKTSVLIDLTDTNNNISFLNNKTKTTDPIPFTQNPVVYTLTNREIADSTIKLTWPTTKDVTSTQWYNRGNAIVISDRYGYATYETLLDCEYVEETTKKLTADIKGTGVHVLTFKDLAGNIQEFATNTYYPQKYYTINLIDSVIYHININNQNHNLIQYGVFNENVQVIIDEEFIAYYSELNVEITKNGITQRSSNYRLSSGSYVYNFSDPGKYVVSISASYGNGNQGYPLNTSTFNFSIINKTSARLAFEFVEISGYEFVEIIRSEQDITDNFKDQNGKISSVFISSNSMLSGNGYYTVTLKYGANEADLLTFSFLINDFIPTISSNVKHGETTTANILISYNPSIIYEQLGECYIKILTYNNDSKTFNSNPAVITIDANSFTNSNPRSFEIIRSNSYFIQVETKNGNIITSFRVNKKDPLNTIAIIIIVVAAIAVVVLTIVIVKLRTRMKIK